MGLRLTLMKNNKKMYLWNVKHKTTLSWSSVHKLLAKKKRSSVLNKIIQWHIPDRLNWSWVYNWPTIPPSSPCISIMGKKEQPYWYLVKQSQQLNLSPISQYNPTWDNGTALTHHVCPSPIYVVSSKALFRMWQCQDATQAVPPFIAQREINILEQRDQDKHPKSQVSLCARFLFSITPFCCKWEHLSFKIITKYDLNVGVPLFFLLIIYLPPNREIFSLEWG